MTKRRHLLAALALAALALTAAAGCGGSSGGSSSGGDYGGQPPRLPGGAGRLAAAAGGAAPAGRPSCSGRHRAYEARIAALRGYPIVANVWASWCGPCRLEFPMLQRLSARYGKRVAFLGINSQDADAAASTFLGEAPVPYPSYTDPDGRDRRTRWATTVGLPDTAFYDRRGELVFLKQGQYPTVPNWKPIFARYALKGG